MSLNTVHKVTLTEGEIGIILCSLEDYVKNLSENSINPNLEEDSKFVREIDSIFEILEGTIDKYYEKVEKAQAKRPTEEW